MRRIRTICAAPAVILACLLSAPAYSMALTWTIQDATFTDGTSLTGSWDFDEDAGYSALSLATEQWDTYFVGASYNFDSFSAGSSTHIIAKTSAMNDGEYTLTVTLLGAMTNLGGRIDIDMLIETYRGGERIDMRWGSAGLVSAPAVRLAEPATLWLLVFGLAGISLVRRRRAT